MFSIRVPGSTSNLGAGFDCLGLALDLWLEARIVEGRGPGRFTGAVAELSPEHDFVSEILGDVLPEDHHLELHSDIPLARGLGSSAAASVAGIALREALRHREPDRDRVFRTAADREGHPDNAAPSVYGGLVLSAPAPTRLEIHSKFAVALAVPSTTIDTKEARKILPDSLPRRDAVAQAAGAAALVYGLTSGDSDLVRRGFEDRIAAPHRTKLIDGYAQAADAGLHAGAHGVTISGSGPTVLAITPTNLATPVANAMAEALTAAGNSAQAMTPSVNAGGYELGDRR
jgi:homoserine kinase